MDRIVTVADAATRAVADVLLSVDGTRTVADLLPDLRGVTGATGGDLLRNGRLLDPRTPATDLLDGDVLTIGAVTNSGAVPTVRARADGHPPSANSLLVMPPPRLVHEAEPACITFPAPPAPAARPRLPLLASVLPLLGGVAFALALRRWEFLAFALMSPLLVLGQAAGDRWSARRTDRRAAAEHRTATAEAEAALRAALDAEATARAAATPGLDVLAQAAAARTALLWQRRGGDADAFAVRLGIGEVPARTVVLGAPGPQRVSDVPVVVDLKHIPAVAVCAETQTSVALARWIVVQLAVLHGPAALRIVVLAPGRGTRWAWTRWLPHTRRPGTVATVATSPHQVQARLDELADPAEADGVQTLVVMDGADPGIGAALAVRRRTAVLWVGDARAPVPSWARARIDAAAGPDALVLRDGGGEQPFVPDLVTVDAADSTARALAPLRDAGSIDATTLPATVRWSDLHDIDLGDGDAATAALCRRWREGDTIRVTLGVGVDGPVELDLRTDGPHVLVAGTTGSGKSELLQALVAGLVAGNAPDTVALLLVDFKGGAAFGACTALPHTVGVLTDLDHATTTRALSSLTAELRRRERLLAAAGVPDYDAWRSCAAVNEALPRMVIVVDEFATLSDELPDFVGGLVGIAQRGRSLGVHLVLATQRPEGAVSADIRANTRARLCLAVAREAESRDVLDSPAALSISRTTPGRAMLRVGSHAVRELQTARVAGPWVPRAPRVRVLPLPGWGDPPSASTAPTAETELELLVAAAARAARRTGRLAASPPWLPPLPRAIALSQLPPSEDSGVTIGAVDLPAEQRQPPLQLAADRCEPLLLVGGPRSGRSTAATAIVTALAARLPPDALHVYAVDSGRALAGLAELPHTGAVVEARDCDRVDRLLAFLAEEAERRRAGDADALPQVMLVVDSWEGLVTATGHGDVGQSQELLLRMLATGATVGIRIVVTADRAGLSGRLAATVADRICLRLVDRADYALLGIPPRQVPGDLPPGRGVRAGDLATVQLAYADEDGPGRAGQWDPPRRMPRRFDPLPARVPLHTVRADSGVVVGVRSDDLAPIVLDPREAGVLLVAGPPGSGRSTTLVSVAAQLRDRAIVAVCPRRGALRRRRDLGIVVDPADGDALAAALDGTTETALLVDDIELVEDPRALDTIEAAVRRARDGDGFVAIAGLTDAMTATFRGPVAQARRSRTGLLLRPDGPSDGELLGLRLRRRPGAAADPPGRGLLAVDGHAVAVQVPDPA